MPRGGAVARALNEQTLPSVAAGQTVVEIGPTDPEGHLEPLAAGEVVLSVPSPEALAREPDKVRGVIAHAGTGVEPLVVEVEVAETLREEELAALLEAAGHTARGVILRIMRDP